MTSVLTQPAMPSGNAVEAPPVVSAAPGPMRIAVIGFRGVPSNYSGIEHICENLFAAFVDRGHHVTIYCRPGVSASKLGTHRGIRLVRTPAPGGRNGETLSHTLFSLTHALAKGDVHDGGKPFDLLSLHAIAPNLFIKVAAAARVPVVSHVHGLDHMREKWKGLGAKVIRQAEREMVRHASRIIAVNNDIVGYYRRLYGVDVEMIPNGVFITPNGAEPDRETLAKFDLTPGRYLTYIGRLVPEKRCQDVIAAFAKVRTDDKLVFVGEGTHTQEYAKMLKRLAANDPRVVFTGLQRGRALDTLFRSARAYVTASELEGMPSSLLECMERAVPSIVSEIPPHRELIERIPGHDAIFPVGDIDALANLLRRCIGEPERFRTIGTESQAHVREHHAWPALAEHTERVYWETLQRSRAGDRSPVMWRPSLAARGVAPASASSSSATVPSSISPVHVAGASERPMRIAVLGFRGVPSSYSGIEAICENLFAAFAERGHHVTIYCRPGVLDAPRGWHRGVRLVRMPAPGGKAGETLSHSAISLAHALVKGDVHDGGKPFDLVSVHSIAPNLFLKMAAAADMPVISHVHGLDHLREKWRGLGSRVIRRAEREMVRHATQVVTVNQEIVNYYRDAYGIDAALVPNGVHRVSDAFTPDLATLAKFGLEPGKFVVSIGRLVPEKRCHDTIEAFKRVKTDRKLVFVGEGRHTPEYVAQIQRQAASDPRIVFTGLQSGDALQTLFRCAALYVTASELEGMPSSLLECMERNVCAITSDIAPHRELMDRVKGYDLLFNVGDVGALAQRIQRTLGDEAHRERLATAARAFVREHYAWPVLAERTEQLYRQVLERAATR